MYNHIMLEIYCMKNADSKCNNEAVQCDNVPKYECLENKCPYLAFTSYENCLCYVNQNSICEKSIALGENIIDTQKDSLSMWRNISFKKIDEAYDEFIKNL